MAKVAVDDSVVTRDSLISSAERCIARFGLAKTTMADVAKEAGVHRATLYRYFADREGLISAVFLRQSEPMIARASRELERSEDVAEGLVQTIVDAVAELRRSELVKGLLSAESSPMAAHLSLMSDEVAKVARTAAEPALMRAREEGRLRPSVAIDDAMAWSLRASFSLLYDQPVLSQTEQVRLLRTFLIPALFRTDD